MARAYCGDGESFSGTDLCPLLRDGRNATHASARTREHSEATTDPCGRLQPEPDSTETAGAGTPREWKNRQGGLFLRLFLLLKCWHG
jgi:hypothetical protein